MSKYKQVYNEIKTQINNGNLAPLQELPSDKRFPYLKLMAIFKSNKAEIQLF